MLGARDYAWKVKREIVNALVSSIDYETVLDIGCAKGEQLRSYVKYGKKGYGLDILNLRKITKNEENIQFIQGDALNLPFKDESFDLVVATEIIEHLPDHYTFLREIHRVLVPGGHLVISTPNLSRYPPFLRGIIRRWFIKRGKYSHIQNVEGKQYGHISEVTSKQLRMELENTGFKIISLEYGAFDPAILPFLPFDFDHNMLFQKVYIIMDKITNLKVLKPVTKWDMIVKAKKWIEG